MNIDFSGRDFTARFEALLTRLKVEVPELTDFNHSDAGVSLTRLVADDSDRHAFYLDRAFAESFLQSAEFMQSLIELGRLVGWPSLLASGASVDLRVTRLDGVIGAVTIPRYTSFYRSDGLPYTTLHEYVLPANASYLDIAASQGRVVTAQVTPSDFAVIDNSGRPKYNLGPNVTAGSILVYDSTTLGYWSEVDSFYRSYSNSYHFMLERYADAWNGVNDTVFLVLGDGTYGISLPVGNLTLTYLEGSGPSGNCGIGTITTVPESLKSFVSVTNTTYAVGGAYAETIERYRDRIPRAVRTQRRGLTLEDYEVLIESLVPGVADCKAIDRNTSNAYPHLYVSLYVIPHGGGALTQLMRDQIVAQCLEWGHFLTWQKRYLVYDAKTLSVDIKLSIGVATGYVPSSVVSAVTAALTDLFSTDNLKIGDTLKFSTLSLAVSRVPGVLWSDFTYPVQDTVSEVDTILVPGTIDITVGT